jgi:signal transduction histidine kinase
MAAPGDTTEVDRPFGFRRLIRYSIALQICVIAALVGVTLWGALQTSSESKQLSNDATNVLLVTGEQQEFARADKALRSYAKSGSAADFGAFSQSRNQIDTIAFAVGGGLSGALQKSAARLYDLQAVYLRKTGDKIVALVEAGDREGAQKLLESEHVRTQRSDVEKSHAALMRELQQKRTESSDAVARRQALNAALIVLSGLLMLGTGIGVLLWIRSQTLDPLENLAIASRKLGHGDLSARVEPGGVEEIALTGRAFNQMADEIERHVGQLHDMSSARSRFVSSVSHELRTPITSLRGYLDLLARGEAGELTPEQNRFVEIAERNAGQLADLIDDLLTLSRVQSGRVNLRSERVDVRELLSDLKAEMLPIARARNVDIVVVDTGELIVRGDDLRLRQAFGNLLSNSIKYSREDQSVVVRALAIDRQAVVSFVDWGMGIPRDDLPQIAEPFFRSDANEGVPGTGLGLAIAKQMIELHGGRLAVESELGSGSTFTVYLPLTTADEATRSAKTSSD